MVTSTDGSLMSRPESSSSKISRQAAPNEIVWWAPSVVPRGRAGQQQVARGGVGEPAQPPRLLAEQLAVGDRQVGVEDDDVGGDPLAAGGVDGDRAVAAHLDPGDTGVE